MSSFEVKAETLTITPHPNADRLELAQVGLFNAVVGKGQFKTGDVALYVPEQAIVPEWLIEELGLAGKLSGNRKDRVKAVRLRGILSQGLVVSPGLLDKAPGGPVEFLPHWPDHDYAESLGVKKWEPEIPASLSGDVKVELGMLRWTDIENIKRFPDIFQRGDSVVVTEKVHGTCLVSTTFFEEDDEGVTTERTEVVSKGLVSKGLAFMDDGRNLYWRAVNSNPVRELARDLKQHFDAGDWDESEVIAVGIYGEVYGSGVQDLTYGLKHSETKLAVFDAKVRFANGSERWVNTNVLHAMPTEIDYVPILWEGLYDIDTIAKIASGKEAVSGSEANLREGVVIRPVIANETWADGRTPRRKIAKFVTDEYLTRKGGTEYN